MEILISNATLMEKLGVALRKALKREKLKTIIVFLKGDLGAGKTTFVQGFIQAFGVKDPITSPTYTLVESYESAAYMIHHFDLYRLDDPNELDLIGFRDYFVDEAFCLIEWPEKGGAVLPSPDLVFEMTHKDEANRNVQVSAASTRGEHVLKQLEKAPFG
ncbi:MAG: tRNA (adenosine(37)-N6)-threonylcarbamoyltransferase complex ATPase subunit type 1 TsaE [Gammaproteobacteria bacterium]